MPPAYWLYGSSFSTLTTASGFRPCELGVLTKPFDTDDAFKPHPFLPSG